MRITKRIPQLTFTSSHLQLQQNTLFMCYTIFLLVQCLIAVVVVVAQQPSIVYEVNPAPGDVIFPLTYPRKDIQTQHFWVAYYNQNASQSVVQMLDPVNPSNSLAPVKIAGPLYWGSVALEVVNGGLGALVLVVVSQTTHTFLYYSVPTNQVYSFPDPSPVFAVAIGDQDPSWESSFDESNALLNTNSYRMYTASGCTAQQPSTISVALYDLHLGAPSPQSQRFRANISSPSCAANGGVSAMIAYEDMLWIVDTQTPPNLFSVNHTGAVFPHGTTYVGQCGFNGVDPIGIKFVRVGTDNTPHSEGIPLYAMILFSVSATSGNLRMCRFSHRLLSPEWSVSVAPLAGISSNANVRFLGSTSQMFAVFASTNFNAAVASNILFINASSGATFAQLGRNPSDYTNTPGFMVTAQGPSCNEIFIVQTSNELLGICTQMIAKSGTQPQFSVAQVCDYIPIGAPQSTVFACTQSSSSGNTVTLLSAVDGSTVWTMPSFTRAGRPLMTPELMWVYNNTNSITALSLTPAVVAASPTSSPPVQGSTDSGGISGGTATGLCFMTLAIGGVIGAMLMRRFGTSATRRSGYTESSNLNES